MCAACHTIGAGGANLAGPNLYAIPGRPIAGDDRFGYTAALRAVGGSWTFAALDAWLANPRRFAPGTSMLYPGLPNGVDRADLIAYLNANGGTLTLPPR